jgi:hypothetical protein
VLCPRMMGLRTAVAVIAAFFDARSGVLMVFSELCIVEGWNGYQRGGGRGREDWRIAVMLFLADEGRKSHECPWSHWPATSEQDAKIVCC